MKIVDFLLIVGAIAILLPLYYIITGGKPNIYTLLLYILILYPTLAALVNGAPFVPTPMNAVEKMLGLAKLKKGDRIYDIGCGDGRIVYMASKKHEVNATGFELSPFVYLIARVRKFLWKSKAQIRFANFKNHNLSDADVIFCYLLPETLSKLEPKLNKELKKGTKIISYAFPLKAWKETVKIASDPANSLAPIWIYEKE